jgi:riboflavin synthase
MFTGIVTDLGVVKKMRSGRVLRLQIGSRPISKGLEVGDSVSVDGVCLTAVKVSRRHFAVEAAPETVGRTTLGDLEQGSRVNLELAARPIDRLGGHIVQGHVDGVARLRGSSIEGDSRRLTFSIDPGFVRYLAPKGSVTLNGVSLTIAAASRDSFEVVVIPHTMEVTTLGRLAKGDRVNLEVDVLAKYAERLLSRT